jgi:glucose/mannose-6-phosphate isomerase
MTGNIERPDTLDLRGATLALPDQVATAAATAAATELPRLRGPVEAGGGRDLTAADIDNIVILGMGGSGLAGDVAIAVAGPFLPVPVVVHKGYGVPNFIDHRTLVVAVSFSGDTEETVEAASLAVEAGGQLVAVSRGGGLGEVAAATGAPHIGIADGIPMPRAGIGAVSVPLLVLFERLGLFPGAQVWIDLAVEQLRRRADQLAGGGHDPATVLAREIGRTLPLAYGAGAIGATAALRFKNQVNENVKLPAFANTHPELCHNELAGWGQAGDITRQVFHLVHFRHEAEHPQIARRVAFVTDAMAEVVAGASQIVADGEGPLAQLFDLVLIGDMATLHLAAAEGVDPGPIPILDALKASLVD